MSVPPAPGVDPGWRGALSTLWAPYAQLGRSLRGRPAPTPPDAFTSLRTVFVGLLSALPLMIFVFSFITPWDRNDEGAVPLVVLIIGAACVLVAAWTQQRPLNQTSPVTLASSYRNRMFISIAVSEVALYAGIVSLLVRAGLWVAVMAGALAAVGMWIVAPSRGHIARDQARIAALGSPLSLTAALMARQERLPRQR